jgi:hypothetical protein
VPVVGQYYKPHGNGVVGAGSTNCGGRIKKDIEFRVSGFPKIYVSANLPSKSDTKSQLAFWFYLPPGVSAKFEQAEIDYGSDANSMTKKLPIRHVDVSHELSSQDSGQAKNTGQSPEEIMDGGIAKAGDIVGDTRFSVSVDMPFLNRQNFSVRLPAIDSGGARIQIDPITFTIVRGVATCGILG